MKRTLPPLNALRAFEAAARLESMSRAADELSVTHAAVSHQVKALEEWVGRPLFRREHRRVRLTEAGADLLPALTGAFDMIDARLGEIMASGDGLTLTVSSATSIASRWLVPRLPRFNERYPEIDVRLEYSTVLVDLAHDRSVDVGLRFGDGNWPGLEKHPVLTAPARALASPTLLARHGISLDDLPLSPTRIAAMPLQHEDSRLLWKRWFEANGVSNADVSRGSVFHDSGALLDLAMTGEAVVLGRLSLASQAVHNGLLVVLHESPVDETGVYWLVHDSRRRDEPQIAAFREFVLAESARDDLA